VEWAVERHGVGWANCGPVSMLLGFVEKVMHFSNSKLAQSEKKNSISKKKHI
jgi:hypothetical protein